jgi:hypothetical protein
MDTKNVVFSEKHTQSGAAKSLWCNTQWANLTMQAKKFELPTLPYFDPKTGLLSKDVNHKLWSQIVSQLHVRSLSPYHPVVLRRFSIPGRRISCTASGSRQEKP